MTTQPQHTPDGAVQAQHVHEIAGGGKGRGSGPPPIPLSKENVVALMAACAGNSALRDATMIRFLYDTGCRVSEACGVRIEDLELDRDRVRFHRSKTDDKLNLKIWPATVAALERYLDFRRQLEGRMFLGAREKVFRSILSPFNSVDRRIVNKFLLKAGLAAGIPRRRCFPHALRHGRAVAMLEDGAPLLSIQRRLGHSSITTTMKYLDVAENWVDEWAYRAGQLPE